MKENDPPIPVAKIDATSESALASRFDVSGYPTIKILKKGQAVDYEGSRTQEGEGPEPPEEVGGRGSLPQEGRGEGNLDNSEEAQPTGLAAIPAGMSAVTLIRINLSWTRRGTLDSHEI